MKSLGMIFVGMCMVMLSTTLFAQAVGDFGNLATGNWGTTNANWRTWDGSGWNTTPTGAPTSADNVWILAGDTVTIEATGKVCKDIAVMNGAMVITTSGYLVASGSFTLAANSYWRQAGGSSALPSVTQSIDAASTIEFNGSQTSLSSPYNYGNLNYFSSSTCGLSSGASGITVTIGGNLYLKRGMRANSSTTANTNTINVAGNVTVDGAFNFTGVNNSASTAGIAVVHIGGSVTLINGGFLTLFESAGPHTGSSTFNIDGDLNIGSGSATRLRSSSSATATATGTINIKGNLTNDGSITGTGGATSGTLILNFIGSSSQTVSGAGLYTVASPILLSISVNNSAGVTLGQNVKANGTLTLTNGTITTSATNLLTLGSGATVGGGSASSFVNGPLAQTLASTSSTPLVFPIGKGTAYRPVTVTVTQDAATATGYTAEMFNSAPTSRTLLGTLDLVSLVRYWNVTKGAGANVTSATIQINYDSDDGVTDATNLRVAKDDGIGNWTDLGGSGSANTTGNITSNMFTNFSDFVLANNMGGSNALPVEMSSFVATASHLNALLRWSTATESNNFGFDIERKSSDAGWSKVGSVAGAGTSTSLHTYTFSDNLEQAGLYEYRIKQIDKSGSFKYSKTAQVEAGLAPKELSLGANYPNPFNPSTNIEFTILSDGRVVLKVYNIIGQEVTTLFNGNAVAGQINKASFNASRLPSGVYFSRMEFGGKVLVKRMMLLK